MYISLKERAIERLVREHKRFYRDKIMLITGVRKEESRRRMGHEQPILKVKARVWTAPLLNWTKRDIVSYMTAFQLPRNEVVEILHMSGECLCGAYAQKGELALIRAFFPETGAYLKTLERKVKAKGFPWGWDEAPPPWFRTITQGQLPLPGFTRLCSSCDARNQTSGKKKRSA